MWYKNKNKDKIIDLSGRICFNLVEDEDIINITAQYPYMQFSEYVEFFNNKKDAELFLDFIMDNYNIGKLLNFENFLNFKKNFIKE